MVCVLISDNNIDGITIRSRCGSMSFCGASGQAYPDSRIMGYPFATAITINDVQVGFYKEIGCKVPDASKSRQISNFY